MDPDTFIVTKPVYIRDRHCGYCHNEKPDFYPLESWKQRQLPGKSADSVTMGMEIEAISSPTYDVLINKGFRRSGDFLYKTDQLRNCCRYYTIRTNLQCLKIEKKHRQVVNRFIKAISEEYEPSTKFDLKGLISAEEKSKKFYTRFESSEFSEEKYQLYKKYQIAVHNDKPEDVTEKQFDRFLCSNPFPDTEQDGGDDEWKSLQNWKSPTSAPIKRIGPTHECYYLDGNLIAVSVMDFLPSGISSIYFIWDPDYAHLSLGTVSGLREILLTSQLGYSYYYLGYYIDDCEKMRYKQKFGGEILDLVNNTYFPLNEIRDYMANGRFFVMGFDEDKKEPALSSEYPVSRNTSPKFKNKSPVNIADDLYSDAVLQQADKQMALLRETYGYSGTIPPCVPGLIPLDQLGEIVSTLSDFCPMVYFGRTGTFSRDPFSKLKPEVKSTVMNCIRLFGLEFVQKTIMIHY